MKNSTYIENLTEALISGMSVSRVPSDVLGDVINSLENYKEISIGEGDTEMVREIQRLIRVLSAKVEVKSDGESILPNNTIRELRKSQKKYSSACEYKISQAIEEKIAKKKIREVKKLQKWKKTEENSKMEEILEECRIKLRNIKSKWNEKLMKMHEEKEKQLERLMLLHEKQLIDFRESFPDALPLRFRKFSMKLLSMRETEKRLAQIRQFREAEQIHKEANLVEKSEITGKTEEFIDLLLLQKNRLIQAQSKELECFQMNWDRKICCIKRNSVNEIDAMHNTIINIEKKIRENRQSRVCVNCHGEISSSILIPSSKFIYSQYEVMSVL